MVYICLNDSVFYFLLLRLQDLFFKEKPKNMKFGFRVVPFPLFRGKMMAISFFFTLNTWLVYRQD